MVDDVGTVVVRVDPHWGPLTIDKAALADKLAEATKAVYDASMAAQYRTEAGFPIQSPWAMLLGGLSQAIDALIDEMDGVR